MFLACTLVFASFLSGQTLRPKEIPAPEEFDWDHEISVGDEAYKTGQYAEAEQHYRKSLEVVERLHMSEVERATSLASVAQSLRYQKKYSEAEPLFREALAIREKVLPPHHPRTAWTLEGLGVTLAELKRPDEAEKYYLQALAIWDRATEDDSCHHGKVLDALGRLYYGQSKYDKGRSDVRACAFDLGGRQGEVHSHPSGHE